MSSGIYAMIGPSGGANQSLASIAGFQLAFRCHFQGRDISPILQQGGLSHSFQDNNLFPHLSIERNVACANPRKQLTIEQRSKVSLTHWTVSVCSAWRKTRSTSGGQQSRAALARILLQDKPILLLDEPFPRLVLHSGRICWIWLLKLPGPANDSDHGDPYVIRCDAYRERHHIYRSWKSGSPDRYTRTFENPPEALKQYLEMTRALHSYASQSRLPAKRIFHSSRSSSVICGM